MWFNRQEAGHRLAAALCEDARVAEADQTAMIVLSIPRGGVVVGKVVAETLQCAHDVMIAKKIGFPQYEELAIGAVAEDDSVILDLPFIEQWHLNKAVVEQQVLAARQKVSTYIKLFRGELHLDIGGRFVILVDDGIATGETVQAAVHWLIKQLPTCLMVAVPVAAPSALEKITSLVAALFCLVAPEDFRAVGEYYTHFEAVSDAEVLAILSAARKSPSQSGSV